MWSFEEVYFPSQEVFSSILVIFKQLLILNPVLHISNTHIHWYAMTYVYYGYGDIYSTVATPISYVVNHVVVRSVLFFMVSLSHGCAEQI